MLFITPAKNVKEAKDYFTRSLAQADYYIRDSQEEQGQWHGRGAELLGLKGEISQKDFFALCDNRNPLTGKQLTARTKAERRVYYDLTFDSPKSVTLAFELGKDERIKDAFDESVKETMGSIEDATQSRVRRNGSDSDRTTGNLLWGSFIHRTTRPVEGVPDPQLHCHAVAFNATYDPVEKKWKAAQMGDLTRDRGYYQAEFHSRFAAKLAALGYGIERDGKSFRLAGIERATTKKFSRRTEIIEAEAERLGITDAKVKSQLGRKTREAKDAHGASISDLRQEWMKRLSEDEQRSIAGAKAGLKATTMDAHTAMDYAVSHSFERESAVPEKKLLERALIQSYGKAGVDDIRSESFRESILRKPRMGMRYVTTRDVLQEEAQISAYVREGRGTKARLGGAGASSELDPQLSKEQREAALLILDSRDKVTALKGKAGAGKTRMMTSTVKAIEASGKKVFTFAPSSDASRGVLRKEGFKNAETVERLHTDPRMQEEVRAEVLWVDEAGLLSTPDMKRLFDLAHRLQCRVVLSGDSGQHAGVKRGDALRILERDAGMKTAVLSGIRRQTNEAYREAVKAISEGDVPGKDGKTRLQAGFEMLDAMGAIVEAQGEQRYQAIAKDYASIISRRTKKDGPFKTALVVSPTHKEADRVTSAIRRTLKDAGRLGTDERKFLSLRPLNFTEAQRGDADEYLPGNIVQFQQNAKGFKRGERVTVTEAKAGRVGVLRSDGNTDFLPLNEVKKFQVYGRDEIPLAKGDKLRITMNGFVPETRPGQGQGKNRLDNGEIFSIDGFTRGGDIRLTNGVVIPKTYGGVTHGYVVTSHASQGKTVDTVLIALGSESLAAANRQQFYVSVSRGRESVRLYTDDKAGVLDAVQRSAARLSATELMGSEEAKPKRGVVSKTFRLHELQRAYEAVRGRIHTWGLIRQQGEGMHVGR
jgi:conjugative relaxase-like TrwC/TraI family protein